MAAEKKLRLKKLADRSSLSICCELFEKLQDGLIACSPDRKIIFLNSYAKKITGLKNSDEKKQVLIDEILSEENSGIIESIFSKILNGSKNEIVIQNKQNANENLIKWLTFKFSLLKIDDAANYVIISLKDITEYRNIETRLSEDESRYKMLANLSTEGIIIHDKGVVVDANESILKLFNTSLSQLKNQNIIELFAATEKDKELLYKNISNKYEKSYEVNAKLQNGTIKTLEITAKNFLYKGKDLRVAVIRNISERKKEEKINNALYKISEAVHDSNNLNELYELIHKILGELIPVENFYIAEYDELTDTISFPFFVDEIDQPPAPQKKAKGLTEYVLNTGKPLLAPPEIFNELEAKGEVVSVGEPSIDWLGVPLVVGSKTIGVLAIQSYNESIRFGKNELSILQFVSSQIANAIERKRAETQLKESEEQIRLLLDSTAEAIFATDVNGICFMANQACAKILGYSEAEFFIGKNMHYLIHHSYPDCSIYPIESCRILLTIKNDANLHNEDEVFWKSDGSKLQIEYWAHPILKNNKVIGAVVTFIDISERIKAQQKIHKYNEELKSLNASKDKFFSVVAHDLRSPFHGLLGLSEIMVDEFDSLDKPDIKSFMINIHKTIKNVYKLIENLLEWSRLQSGKMSFSPAKLNFSQLVENVQQVLVGVSSLKGITILNNVKKNIFVSADEKMITSVLQNLITNSIKFSNPNSEIEVTAELSEQFIKVSIRDNGIGMDEDMISKLFTLDNSITTPGTAQEKGTGLGLILCHEMIEKHNGKIWAESKKGFGTTFHFTLPLFLE